MTNRRKGQAQAQAQLTREGRRLRAALRVLPRTLQAAEAGARGLKPSKLLRYVDLPPAIGMLVVAAIFALVCVFYLNQVTALSNANYDLQRLQREHEQLVQEGADLRLQLGQAQSLPNIESAARSRLGMVPIGDKYTYLNIQAGPLTAMPPLPTPVVSSP